MKNKQIYQVSSICPPEWRYFSKKKHPEQKNKKRIKPYVPFIPHNAEKGLTFSRNYAENHFEKQKKRNVIATLCMHHTAVWVIETPLMW